MYFVGTTATRNNNDVITAKEKEKEKIFGLVFSHFGRSIKIHTLVYSYRTRVPGTVRYGT